MASTNSQEGRHEARSLPPEPWWGSMVATGEVVGKNLCDGLAVSKAESHALMAGDCQALRR
jgi:hypothetical protein